MEKSHRLFLRNLPNDIEKKDLEKLFDEHGTVTNIDIKEKIQNDGSRIAFVNISTTDKRLNTCFRAVNKAILRGNTVHVEVAKESYLDRLKREREEAANCKTAIKEPQVVAQDQPIERINIKLPKTIKSKPTKRIYNFDTDNAESTENNAENCDASNFTYDTALQVETFSPKKQIKIENQISLKTNVKPAMIQEKKILSESEIKRKASVKQKIQNFRAKEQLISHALKAVDSTSINKKIVFSDDIEKIIDSGEKKSKSLFDEDDDAENQDDWNEDKFLHDEKRNAKLAMSLKNVGRDKRFIIDERFLDDDENAITVKNDDDNDENDLKKEAKWQLEILGNVLGKPLKARDEKLLSPKKQNKMVRYDPTTSGHQAHELEMTKKPAIKVKKGKVKTYEEQLEENGPIPVSSEVFYTVSENLTESLKPQEGFSLLKTFGTATATDKNRIDAYDATVITTRERHNDTKNPFKYESSDDEGPNLSIDQLTCNNDLSKNKMNNHSNGMNDTFFFVTNDQRFCDAEEFFRTRPSTTENFTNIRRELKQIVRSKIRNNVKKNTPWRNKKIGTQKKMR